MDSDRPNAERTVLAVLGASNVWLALPEIVEHLASRFHSSKLDLHTAHGPGRSYGNVAGMLGWKYPSLRSCGVFEALERAAETDTPTRRCALVTDIGNDIGYGAKSDEILDWVEECIEALRASETAISVTSLPVESVTDLAPWKFGLSRRILFPFRNLTYADCRARIEEIESSLSRDADALGVDFLTTEREFYGFDSIHIRRACRRKAFGRWLDRTIAGDSENPSDSRMSPGTEDEVTEPVRSTGPGALTLWRRLPTGKALSRTGDGRALAPLNVSPTVTLHVH